MKINITYIFERLSYAPTTGAIRWKSHLRAAWIGRVAGTVGHAGYRLISLDGTKLLAHRVAWLLTHGAWPEDEIDHINGDKDDNRIVNLREATRQQNAANSTKRRHNKSGYKGVTQTEHGWAAFIRNDGKNCYLGTFKSVKAASLVYLDAVKKITGNLLISIVAPFQTQLL